MPRLYAFALLGQARQPGYAYISIGIPRDVAFAEVNRMLRRNLAGLGLMTMLPWGRLDWRRAVPPAPGECAGDRDEAIEGRRPEGAHRAGLRPGGRVVGFDPQPTFHGHVL